MKPPLVSKKKKRKTKEAKARLKQARKRRKKKLREKRRNALQEKKLIEATKSKRIPPIPLPVRQVVQNSTSAPRSFEKFVRAVLVRKK
jgi:hypothetical protein